MKTLAIIQARLGSTRLPGKTLLDLLGKPILQHVVERVSSASLVDGVIVATTTNEEDKKIIEVCTQLNVNVYAGSTEDVLDRFFQAAKYFPAENIVRITADCPLADPVVIDSVVSLHFQSKADYTSNVLEEVYPDGEDVEVFTFAALERAWRETKMKSEREHVTLYFRQHPELFKLQQKGYHQNLHGKRWTVDEPADYEFIKAVYNKLYTKNPLFGMKDVLCLLEKHPELEQINAGFLRDEGLIKSLKNDDLFR